MKKPLHSKPLHLLFIQILCGIAISVFSMLIFTKIRSEVFEQEFSSLDRQILFFFYQLRSPWLTQLMIVISYCGAQVVVAGGILITLFLWIRNHKKEALLFACING